MATRAKKSSLKQIVGMNVRLERTRQGMTQEGLAGLIGTDQAHVSQVERGLISSTLDLVERMATALKVRPADLVDESLGRSHSAGRDR